MRRKKQAFSGEWKPVKLEGAVCSELQDLVGIEELTDYRLEKADKRRRSKAENIIVSTTKRKINSAEEEENVNVKKPKTKKLKQRHIVNEQVSKKAPKVKTKVTTKPISESENDSDHDILDSNEDIILDINTHAWSALGVPSIVIKALADQKFLSPTVIQSLTLAPAIFGHRDILGAAETGSGKTLAFGIPIINGILELKKKGYTVETTDTSENLIEEEINSDGYSSSDNEDYNENYGTMEDKNSMESHSEEDCRLSDEELNVENSIGCVRVIDNLQFNTPTIKSDKPLYALILTPTRELAIQIKDHLTKAAKYTDIKIAVVVGGMAAVKQERILSKGPEIVIATPGRLWELIEEGNPHLNKIDSIKYLAIDETDRMMEKGHFQELHSILEKINLNPLNVKRQTFVFSATLTLVHDIPDYLQRKKNKRVRSKISKLTSAQKLQKVIDLLQIKNPKIVDITKERGTAGSLTECRIACTMDHKDYYLYYFLKRHSGRTLVFCNSIGCVKRLATLFNILECNPLPLHASMQQRQRLKNLERFQADNNGVLIATDVAARGLDIPNVEHVIHYQVPRTSESYVHRSGRTARAQKEGITVLMMEPSEKQSYSKLCKTLGRTQDIPSFPVIDRLLIAVKERVNIAREIDLLDLKCKRDNAQKGWLQKAVEDMDVILDEEELETTMESKEMADLKRKLKAKRQQLASLLAKPLFPKGFSGKYFSIDEEFQLGQGAQKAVDVMKKAIEDAPKVKQEKRPAGVTVKRNRFRQKGKKKLRKA